MSELCMGSYQRHYYRLGAPVREIVRRGQDTLYRLKLGRETQHIADMIDRYYGGGNYPQSLGELCIELAQDNYRCTWNHYRSFIDGKFRRGLQRDIQELRRALFHKNK